MRFVCVNKLGEEEISVLVSLAYFCTYLGLDSGQRATGFVWPFSSAHTIDRRTHEILKIKYSTTTQKKKTISWVWWRIWESKWKIPMLHVREMGVNRRAAMKMKQIKNIHIWNLHNDCVCAGLYLWGNSKFEWMWGIYENDSRMDEGCHNMNHSKYTKVIHYENALNKYYKKNVEHLMYVYGVWRERERERVSECLILYHCDSGVWERNGK